jgi:eukaryotic-like serine/threonine-protein kinase
MATTPPRGTVTFLFTDIEGYTTAQQNGSEQKKDALARYKSIMRRAVENHSGYVFEMTDDGCFAAFATATGAIEAALEAQRTFMGETAEVTGLGVRMALHTGVAEEHDGDYLGPPVNRAAHLLSAAHGGQIILSAVTYNLVSNDLTDMEPEADLQYLGEHRLRDPRFTERIFQLLAPGLPSDFPPLKTRGRVDTAIPTDTPKPEEPRQMTVSDEKLDDERYDRERLLGSGGMSEVYLAYDRRLGHRPVALKVLRQQYASNEQFIRRFRREASNAASLSGEDHIVAIYDRGETEDGAYYIAMEYVGGGTLEDRINARGALPPGEAADMALQVAQALQAAHRRGIIHRDVKPQNILLTELGKVKVADFGIARAASLTTLTMEGSVMGTPYYISPEQADGAEAKPQSDLYSLGVVLYEMLTGELPFKGDTPIAIVMQHLHHQVRPPKEINLEVPERLNAITMRLLAKEPEQRYPDAAALIDDLKRAMGAEIPTVVEDERKPSRGAETVVVAPAARSSGQTMVADEATDRGRGVRELPPPWWRRVLATTSTAVFSVLAAIGLLVVAIIVAVIFASGALRADQVAVPRVVGETLDGAENQVGNNFDIQVEDKVKDEKPANTILSQRPEGGKAEKGSTISVVVVGTQVANVPRVVDQGRDAAVKELEDAGFRAAVEQRESSFHDQNRVMGQDPSGGKRAEVGSGVTITVGTGPSTVRVPDLSGDNPEQATRELQGVGLELGMVTKDYDANMAEGSIFYQDPAAEQSIKPGSEVNVTVSLGPGPPPGNGSPPEEPSVPARQQYSST